MNDNNICGTCKYHRRDNKTNDWICTCVDSDLCGVETEYDYVCEEYYSRWEK